ncbi:exported hypothetical protein [Burkholderiales bacterium]|nr:exported hypothetical protein [Burkholderiales bacterium]
MYSASLALGTMCLTTYLVGGAAGTVLGGFVAGRQRRSELVVAIALCLAAAVALVLATGKIAVAALLPTMFALGCGSGTAGPSRDLLVRKAATSRFGTGSYRLVRPRIRIRVFRDRRRPGCRAAGGRTAT